MSEFKLYFTPKQTEALEIIERDYVQEVLYGGAKGGGKSVFAVLWAFLECQKLIELFKIPQNPDFILPVGFMGRKRGVDFTKTTLETWKKMIPASMYKIRPMDKEIVVDGRVKILYGGMDDETSVNKFNSAEFAFVLVDQAEEINRDDLGLLKGTLRLRRDGVIPKYKVLLTANPAPCFLKADYIDAREKDDSKVFIQALPTDNPFLDEAYIETLKDAFKHRPELIRAYVYGSWDDIEGLDILIKDQWVQACINRNTKIRQDIRVTCADVARFGHDESVIYNLIDNVVVGERIYGMKPADNTAAQIVDMARTNQSDMVVIDGDGFGGGVVDFVRRLLRDDKSNLIVYEINSGKKSTKPDKFANMKTEMWFYASDQFAEGNVGIPSDPVLTNDLTIVKYFTASGGRFQIETKKDIRKRISRSPDRADALIYGLWGAQFVRKKNYDFNRNDAQKEAPKRSSYGWGDLMNGASTGLTKGYGW